MLTDVELKLEIELSLARRRMPMGMVIDLKRREEKKRFWTPIDSLFQRWRDEGK